MHLIHNGLDIITSDKKLCVIPVLQARDCSLAFYYLATGDGEDHLTRICSFSNFHMALRVHPAYLLGWSLRDWNIHSFFLLKGQITVRPMRELWWIWRNLSKQSKSWTARAQWLYLLWVKMELAIPIRLSVVSHTAFCTGITAETKQGQYKGIDRLR